MSAELHGVGALGVGFDMRLLQLSYIHTMLTVTQTFNTTHQLTCYHLVYKLKLVMYNMSATTLLSAESDSTITTQAEGRSLTMYQLSSAPIDGLSIKGSLAETSAEGGDANGDDGISANVNAKYTIGQVFGYAEGGYQAATGAAANDETIYYDNKFLGIQFDVNDAVSVSWNVDESDQNTRAAVAAGSTAGTKTVVGMEQETLQLAYTVGGATIGIADIEVTNADYTAGKEENQTVISLGISF